MESKKYFFFLLSLVVALAVNSYGTPDDHNRYARAVGNKSHNLIVGARQPGDGMLTREYIYIRPTWMKKITFEKSFNVTGYQVFTQIAAYDQKTDGSGAYASVLSGGPGFQTVKLKFTSQRGRGIDFVVEFFGR